MKTSLEKSHSKMSNFKLMLISIILSISFPLICAGVALLKTNQVLGIIIISISSIVTILFTFLMNIFKR